MTIEVDLRHRTLTRESLAPPRGRTPKVTREWPGGIAFPYSCSSRWPEEIFTRLMFVWLAGRPREGGHWPTCQGGTGRVTRPGWEALSYTPTGAGGTGRVSRPVKGRRILRREGALSAA